MRRKIFLLSLIIAMGFSSFCALAKEIGDGAKLQKDIAGKILRFHILANSDRKEDQRIKETVRDGIGEMMGPLLKDSDSLEETKKIVHAHMDEIELRAEEILRKNGYDYRVTARLGVVDFPEKTYGDYTFPPGEYEALQILLGEGKGHNWWCVLYPNMCFRGSVYEIVEEDAKISLREVLSPEEYREIFNKKKYRIRFKFLEYFK